MELKKNQTKECIWNSLNELLNYTTFEKITVDMILSRSGISKSTFYRHFRDKYDVLNYSSTALAERLVEQRICNNWKEFFPHMFYAISQHSFYYKRAFQSSGQNAHSDFLYTYSYGFVERCYLFFTRGDVLSIYDRYMISHYCHGCVEILKEWLNEPDVLTPNEMAEIFYQSMPLYLRDAWLYR